MAASICELVDELPNTINKYDQLQKIQILVSQIHPRNLGEVVGNISFNIIFECLGTTTDSQEIAVCCDVLDKLLLGLDSHSLLPQFADDLVQGLSHPSECVQLLCLRQAYRVAEEIPQQLIQHPDILNEIIAQLGDESLSTAKQAALVIMALGKNHDAASYIFQGQGINSLQQLLDVSDTIRFRVYELITDFSRQCPENLSLCCGFLQKLVNEIYLDDVLVRLNAIELLTRLASVQHGLDFLNSHRVMSRLDEMMKNVDSDPMMAFLLPGLVKFFGAVAYLAPKEVCQQHPSFLSLVFSLHENHDPTTRGLAAETLGMVGRKVEGKRILEQQGTRMLNTCKQLGSMLRDPVMELKVKVLGALENLFTLPVEEQTSDLLGLMELWYSRLDSQPMALFMELLEKPFEETRCAVFRVLVAMATQPWAQVQFRDHPTFSEYLLNRAAQHSKQEKEEKFRIVRTLVESPTIIEVMGRVYYVKLKEYVKAGPFFVQAESAVAMDSET